MSVDGSFHIEKLDQSNKIPMTWARGMDATSQMHIIGMVVCPDWKVRKEIEGF
jgi:hypothetical protein